MLRRVSLSIALLFAALGPAVPLAEAQNLFYFWFRNCDTDRATINVDVFDGADMARIFPISQAKGLAHRQSAQLHCVPGTDYGEKGCHVFVDKGSIEYRIRIEEDTCFEGRYEYWVLPHYACSC
ncbi:hypothetical protein [Stella sp.]|uniref:hypothetical protein n=1 Tax=Stella sp. TaxID=2912054 RepID=UPI0035B091A6